MQLESRSRTFDFVQVPLCFGDGTDRDVFARKNNRTVLETLAHRRYARLGEQVRSRYPAYLDWPLGEFLYALKSAGDSFYTKFLNRYGDQTFSRFWIEGPLTEDKGLYAYMTGGKLVYIGRCRDTFGKRINNGYGRIAPKNCYLDGQATNCHLNALITARRSDISFWVCSLEDEKVIIESEKALIARYAPDWNLR